MRGKSLGAARHAHASGTGSAVSVVLPRQLLAFCREPSTAGKEGLAVRHPAWQRSDPACQPPSPVPGGGGGGGAGCLGHRRVGHLGRQRLGGGGRLCWRGWRAHQGAPPAQPAAMQHLCLQCSGRNALRCPLPGQAAPAGCSCAHPLLPPAWRPAPQVRVRGLATARQAEEAADLLALWCWQQRDPQARQACASRARLGGGGAAPDGLPSLHRAFR